MRRNLLAVVVVLLCGALAAQSQSSTAIFNRIEVGPASAVVGGVLNVNTTSQATTGTAEEIVATYTLPANTLSADGKAIRITAWGTTAANTNGKVVRIRAGGIGGTVMAVTTVSASAASWRASAILVRTGAATQVSGGLAYNQGSPLPTSASPTLTLANANDIVVTGTTATAIGDMTFKGLIVESLN